MLALAHAWGADFEVTTTNDAGFGSYRQAILDSNDNPGPDRIVFNIPGSGVQTIHPLSPLRWHLRSRFSWTRYTQLGARLQYFPMASTLCCSSNSLPSGVDISQLSGGFSTVRGRSSTASSWLAYGLFLHQSRHRLFHRPDPSGRLPRQHRRVFSIKVPRS
jgi:hypothetical protein